MLFLIGIHYIRLLTGVPIGDNKNQNRNQNTSQTKQRGTPNPSKPSQSINNANSNSLITYGKGFATPDAPFMKSVLPVTSLFSTIKSGVQTSVTAAVKAGKISPP